LANSWPLRPRWCEWNSGRRLPMAQAFARFATARMRSSCTFATSAIQERTQLVNKGFLMNPVKVIAVVLIIGGILGLVYGGFSYTKDTTVVKLGPLEVSAKERQTVNVPMWAGVGAVVVGGLLLVFGAKR
jgi:uncharacterized membrane protein YidH (DUF202 family)